jgi:mRNA-degrading endonuclease RelE of RelBE toxin-antitoxin system
LKSPKFTKPELGNNVDFLISDTFTASLARLTGDEQKAVKTTAFDLQMNPANPGMSFHKVDRARDKNFWSVRVSQDIRLIVHRTAGSLLLCYVDHHDKAYDWAERRRLEAHPKTGAAQIVEVRETVKDIIIPNYVQADIAKAAKKELLFTGLSDDELLGYGVPVEWLKDVRAADEDSLLALADHLPAEAAEALLELATGGRPGQVVAIQASLATAVPPSTEEPPKQPSLFEHPDAQRRFRVIATSDELQQALEFPWERWTVFLHPEQRDLAVRDYSGPARVAGSAGTGKTVVALHRAAHLARANQDARVLLATFSDTLASALQTKLQRLLVGEPRLAERIDVSSLDAIGLRLHKALLGPVELVGRQALRVIIKSVAGAAPAHKFSQQFLVAEWDHVVDAWQLSSWEDYRDVARLGRKTRLSEAQRRALWSIFDQIRVTLVERKVATPSVMFHAVAKALGAGKNPPFQYAVIDEAQDVSVAQLRMLSALGGNRPNALFFGGDLGQRIFQQPFSWKALGVDVRGRSKTLRVNYRTSHQIRACADRLLPREVGDVDGNTETRSGTVSVFNGPNPVLMVLDNVDHECQVVAKWLKERVSEGLLAHELGAFVRSSGQLERAKDALKAVGVPFKVLDEHVETASGHAAICTMHLAKGLEFRAVVVMACDDEVLPLQERIETVGDEGDLQEVYDTERQLLYVACTRARDFLLITGKSPASEFLDDLRPT